MHCADRYIIDLSIVGGAATAADKTDFMPFCGSVVLAAQDSVTSFRIVFGSEGLAGRSEIVSTHNVKEHSDYDGEHILGPNSFGRGEDQ